MTSVEMSEADDWLCLEARLICRFNHVHPDEVRQCLRDSMAQFEGATIRTYLAVLIERAATERLRVLDRAMRDVDASYGADSRLATQTPQPPNVIRERDNSRAVRTSQRVVPAIGG